ncbi:efflux transporter periplasmic adaptor subunit [Paramagnetospirillum kuznetsovii]|uniref:Efflux transporter periplasmic adaptor subunit n=1 Tax=Paramagnetospirillum kuznetsovii TaxID=2053833 RepID=A0A364NTH2_9PROT|nr:efflux RND transporter periplasmic adaptor subunit [Paramagnetospirillum kuznetsovii]RAU20371.1 efflux transporter periplasmic adaptor subunit [Paramagnetospirillum kuznetsovii]
MKAKRMIIMLVGSAVVFGGVFGFVGFRNTMIKQYFANMPKPVVSVTAATASLDDWRSTVFAVGTLQAVNGVDIAGSLSGLVKEIGFQSGQEVKRGQILVRLDSDVELGDLRSAEAELALAHTSNDRNVALLRSNTVSVAALEKTQAELKVKQAKVAGLHAQIAKKSVAAPFDGVLGVRKIDLGQYVQPGQVMVNLQDLSLMLCDFTVSQKDLSAVSVGQNVRMTSDAWPAQSFDGAIAAIEPQVDSKTGMVTVQAKFPNAGQRLRPGMFAKIEIDRPATERVVTIPVSAVSYNLHGDAVFVVRDGDKGKIAERAVVQLGDRRDGTVVVKQGVKPGDIVVTSGQVKLENGSPIQIAEDDPLKAPAKTALK